MGGTQSRKARPNHEKLQGEDKEAQVTRKLEARTELSVAKKGPLVIHENGISALAFPSSPRSTLLTGGSDGKLVLFDAEENKILAQIVAHTSGITQIEAVPGTKHVLTSSRDRSLRLWTQSHTFDALATLGEHPAAAAAFALSPDGRTVLSGGRDGSLRVWDLSTQSLKAEEAVSRNVVTSMRWRGDTNTVLQASEDKMLRVWDVRTLEPTVTFPVDQYFHTCCDIAPDNVTFATGANGFGGQGCYASLWDMRAVRKVCDLRGHTEGLTAVRVLAQARICTAARDGTIRLWTDGRADRTLLQSQTPVTSLALHEGALAAGLGDGTIQLPPLV